MAMPVVRVRSVRMFVNERLVSVAVGVWLAGGVVRAVSVLVMGVVHVGVLVVVFVFVVCMVMRVLLANQQSDARGHEAHCGKFELFDARF